jgi:hypothetical protein
MEESNSVGSSKEFHRSLFLKVFCVLAVLGGFADCQNAAGISNSV